MANVNIEIFDYFRIFYHDLHNTAHILYNRPILTIFPSFKCLRVQHKVERGVLTPRICPDVKLFIIHSSSRDVYGGGTQNTYFRSNYVKPTNEIDPNEYVLT